MIFELTNEQRKYLGLNPVEKNWEIVKLNNYYLYFDGDTIRKKIFSTEKLYSEMELDEKTSDNRTVLLPKTSKGKPKKLNDTATRSFSSFGVYFSFLQSDVEIGNFTTNTTYHSERLVGGDNIETLKKWLEQWTGEATESDLKEIEAFKVAERKHCKYKEGDFFAFKYDRRNYGFGRILIDVAKRSKTDNLKENKNYGLMQLMAKPLIVKLYHKISNTFDVDLEELSLTMALPSQAVMDNQFYYGQSFIIGHKPLAVSEYDMLISYSKSIKRDEENIVYLQYGFIFKEIDSSKFNKYLKMENKNSYTGYDENPFRNESVGAQLDTRKLAECIHEKSNNPYWENTSNSYVKDMRNPINIDIKREIFKAFGLDADKTYEQNLIL